MTMDIRKRYRRGLAVLLAFCLVIFCGMTYMKYQDQAVPDQITVFAGDPLTAPLEKADVDTSQVGSYQVDYKLFGLLPFKTVSVDVMANSLVVPCGMPAGIYVETDGVLVVDCAEVTSLSGVAACPAKSILKAGDYITSADQTPVSRKSQLVEAVSESQGKEMTLGVRRNGEEFQVRITPAQVAPGEYKLGVWVRDNTQGIGMVTYVTGDGRFGALGHGISDSDTGQLMETSRGLLYDTDILSVIRGREGTPGELVGYIDYHARYVKGRIDGNTPEGIFGQANEQLLSEAVAKPVQICLKQDVKTGPATILTSVDGEVKEYDVEIEEVNLRGEEENKGMVIRVTDGRLLSQTGGIVQGMSGSPILQNGKLAGAVTHVFVKDPTKGYGVFIENMLQETEK